MDDSNSGGSGAWSDTLASLVSSAEGAYQSYAFSQGPGNPYSGNAPILYGNTGPTLGNPGFGIQHASASPFGGMWVILLALVAVFLFLRAGK